MRSDTNINIQDENKPYDIHYNTKGRVVVARVLVMELMLEVVMKEGVGPR